MPGKNRSDAAPSSPSVEDSSGLLDTRQFVIVMFSLLSASSAAAAAGFTTPGTPWNPAPAAATFLPALFVSLAAMNALIRGGR